VADRQSREIERENRRVKGLERSRPLPAGFVRIAHPTVKGTTRVSEKSLAHWKARGWAEVTDDAPASPAPQAAPAAVAENKTAPAPRRGSTPTGQES
jgi:hypothetical protein